MKNILIISFSSFFGIILLIFFVLITLHFCWPKIHHQFGLLKVQGNEGEGKIPLVLVAGLGGNDLIWHEWTKRFVSSEVNNYYDMKIFAFESYDTSILMIGSKLSDAIFLNKKNNIVFLTHSQGGLAVLSYMVEHGGLDNTKMVISMATPFHGTPLASLSWSYQGFCDVFPFLGFMLKPLVPKEPKGVNDLQWDNFDSAMPQNIILKCKKENDDQNKWIKKITGNRAATNKYIAIAGLKKYSPKLSIKDKLDFYWSQIIKFVTGEDTQVSSHYGLDFAGSVMAAIPTANSIKFVQSDGFVPFYSACASELPVNEIVIFNNYDHADLVNLKGSDDKLYKYVEKKLLDYAKQK